LDFFSVSLVPISGNPKDEWTFPINAFATFDGLTNEIYFRGVKKFFQAYTYGTTWVLRDKASGQIFKHARMISGVEPGKPVKDERTLQEIGIKAGMILEVVSPNDIQRSVI
jgi:hypothetical protein